MHPLTVSEAATMPRGCQNELTSSLISKCCMGTCMVDSIRACKQMSHLASGSARAVNMQLCILATLCQRLEGCVATDSCHVLGYKQMRLPAQHRRDAVELLTRLMFGRMIAAIARSDRESNMQTKQLCRWLLNSAATLSDKCSQHATDSDCMRLAMLLHGV